MALVKALVTGASGFIGGHLCAALCARGHEVTAMIGPGGNARWLSDLPLRRAQANLVTGAGVAEAVRDAGFVFHLAGVTRALTRSQYRVGNEVTSENLLQAIREARAPVRRLVYVSSQAAAGPSGPGRAAVETDAPRPITTYGASKLAAERFLLRHQTVCPVTVARPPAVYGPRDRNLLGVFRAAARGVFPLPRGGRAAVSLVHVSDLVAGLCLAAEHPSAAGQTYYLSGTSTTWSGFGRVLAGVLGRRVRLITIPAVVLRLAGEVGDIKWRVTGQSQVLCRRKVRDMLQPAWVCSDAKARRDLGYRPALGLAEGLERTLAWYRRHGWL